MDQLGGVQVLLDVALEDLVEHLVWRQRVVVALLVAQLGRGRPLEHRRRHQLAALLLVPPPDQLVHLALVDVLQHGEAAGHVAVERGVADRHLGLVAGRDHEPAELVRQRHHDVAADARLEVLLGHVRLAPLEGLAQQLVVGRHRLVDADLAEVHPEVLRDRARVGPRALARVRRRHRDARHALGAERVGGDQRGQRRVDPARQRDHHALEAVLLDVVAQPGAERGVHLGLGPIVRARSPPVTTGRRRLGLERRKREHRRLRDRAGAALAPHVHAVARVA